MEFPPQNVRMPRFLSAEADTLAAGYLVEALQNPTPNAPFSTINYTHHIVLRIIAELFNIIKKYVERQSTNRNNGWRWEVAV